MTMMKLARLRCAGAVVLCVALLAGCAPVVVGGAMVGTALVATDRRPVGIQIEDEAIESRLGSALSARFPGDTVHIRVVSYNLKVLLLGQVPTDEARESAQRLAESSMNVRSVLNELTVGPPTSTGTRNNDVGLSAKVRTALIESDKVSLGVLSVTTERGVVYLLGRVTQAEGAAAAGIASRVSGVRKVVKAFDYLTPQEEAALKAEQPKPAESQRK
jgi:osmotically-inducible protein OsmY